MILVVGGAGFIGSHIGKLLRESGEPHVIFDNLESGHRSALQGSPFVPGDLRNPLDIETVLDQFPGIDVVMHFAAYIAVGESVREPGKYYRNNTLGALNLLDGMRRRGIDKFVFSSTAAVYGHPRQDQITEDHPTLPINPYGWSKLMVERMLGDFDAAHGIKSVVLRYFNAAGSDPEGVLGEDHDPEEHLIPVALLAASGKRPSLKVFGSDYPTPDGTCVRDYIHVLDLADAHIRAARHLREEGDSVTYNLGNGRGFSVREVIETASKVVGSRIPHEYADPRPGDSPQLVADASRIQNAWGWKPRYSELTEIIEHAWRWRQCHPEGFGD